jgi:peptidyl-prolyl cis-trans isomerase D
LASALLRDAIERLHPAGDIDDAIVQSFIDDTSNGPIFVSPEQRNCTHILLNEGGEASEATHTLAQEMVADQGLSIAETAHGLSLFRDRFMDRAEELGIEVRPTEALTVAGLNDDGSTPSGFTRFAAEFVEAVFLLEEIGDVSGPVDTQFGTHFIMLLGVTPGVTLEPAAAESIARLEVSQQAHYAAMRTLLIELSQSYASEAFYENLDVLQQGREQLLRAQSEAVRQGMAPE